MKGILNPAVLLTDVSFRGDFGLISSMPPPTSQRHSDAGGTPTQFGIYFFPEGIRFEGSFFYQGMSTKESCLQRL